MNNKQADIAIVIPVYKSTFFEETLESVVQQTDKNYNIYIGNDASGDDKIEPIIKSIRERENLNYKRFENNMGQISLPLHWNRCLDMVQNEKWIWLFSDDDVMDDNCLENFRKTQKANSGIRLFRFNTVKFCDEILLKENIFPERVSIIDFLKLKFGYSQESYVVEYIFDKSLLDDIGKFSGFPLGWCSDDLFWIKTALCTDILTIQDSLVYWRYSNQNTSGRINTTDSASKKILACRMFMHELKDMDIFLMDKDVETLFFHWIMRQFHYLSNHLNKTDVKEFLTDIYEVLPDVHKNTLKI